MRRYEGVTAYEGLPGSGKTYQLAAVGVRAQKAGRPVLVNSKRQKTREPWFPSADGCFMNFAEFCDMVDGTPWVILFDELPLWANSKKWQEFPDGLFYELTQIRKSGLELHYSTIDWMMVDINIRRVTFWVWEHRSVGRGRIGDALGLHHRKLLPPPERRRKNKGVEERPRDSHFFRIDKTIRESYDTFAKIESLDTAPAPAPIELEQPPAATPPGGARTAPPRRPGPRRPLAHPAGRP